VALQGTLDTFSLPDVLRLLATTGKTGCLHLDGDRGRGRVWMDDGSLVAATADRAQENAPIDEVIFEMLRFKDGSFRFAVDEPAPDGAAPADIEAALQRGSRLLDEWRGLEAVVPSLDHQVQMAPELTVSQVTIDGQRWEALVAIGGGRTVSELGSALGEGELGITRIVSDLVELGIAVVEKPSSRRSSRSDRRNVTDIGSRGDGEATNGRRAPTLPPRETVVADDPSRAWSPAAEADPTPSRRYRESGSARRDSASAADTAPTPRASSSGATSKTPKDGGSSRASAASRRVGTVTPPGGNRKVEVNGRTRQISTARSSRARRTPTSPVNGDHSMPLTQTRNGHALAPAPTPNPAPSLPSRDPSGETSLRRLQPLPSEPLTGPEAPLPIPDRNQGPLLPPSLEGPALDDSARGPIFPPSLETRVPPLQPLDPGRLGPSPLPSETGQIPTLAASALPSDLNWAAEDDDAPIGPPTAANSVFGQPSPMTPPTSPLSPPPPPGGAAPVARPRPVPSMPPSRPIPNVVRNDGETAAHVQAMSSEARAAVEATVGRAGGGNGGLAMAGVPQEQLLNRGQLLRFLSTVR
jgi:uncharacterized protein DUF4388